MKVRCEGFNGRIKSNNAGSERRLYSSSSDDELPGGLCPCIPSPCFIYKGILNRWKRHDFARDSNSLVLCRFKDQSNSSCMTTLAFLISEVKEIEDLLSSIEQETNIKHDRSRGKLLQLRQEIMDTLLVKPSENADVIQEFMDRIKAYKKKLILVNLENALNRNDSIYAESLTSNTLLDKLHHRNVTSRPESQNAPTPGATGCESLERIKCSKKQNVSWPWKCWTRNTFSKEGDIAKDKKQAKRFSNTISGSKKCQAERKGLGVVQSWPAFSSLDKGRLSKFSTLIVVQSKSQKECQTESFIERRHEKENQTSKASVNQGISAQSIFLKEVSSSAVYEERGTGSNSMLSRPGISRCVSAQSSSLVQRCEGVTQTISGSMEQFSSETRVNSSSNSSMKQLSEEDDFWTTSCSHPSIAVLGITSESETMDEYNVSTCTDEKPPSEICDKNLWYIGPKTEEKPQADVCDKSMWYISAKQLCDEMFEKAYIACQ